MGARQYSPLLGRFLEVDPIEGGCSNAYEYVSGDPVNHLDVAGTANCKKLFAKVMEMAFRDKRSHGGGFHGAAERMGDFTRFGLKWSQRKWQNHVAEFERARSKLRGAFQDFWRGGCDKPGGFGGELYSQAYRVAYVYATPTRAGVAAFYRQRLGTSIPWGTLGTGLLVGAGAIAYSLSPANLANA
jgi:hypothetical protein